MHSAAERLGQITRGSMALPASSLGGGGLLAQGAHNIVHGLVAGVFLSLCLRPVAEPLLALLHRQALHNHTTPELSKVVECLLQWQMVNGGWEEEEEEEEEEGWGWFFLKPALFLGKALSLGLSCTGYLPSQSSSKHTDTGTPPCS